MATKVTLTVVLGNLQEPEFVFEMPATCIIGRGEDCDLRVPGDATNLMVSRHHCQLEIDPPQVRIRDLGSRNGTYLNGHCIGNGRCIGLCKNGQTPDPRDAVQLPAHELHDEDVIRLGNALEIRVRISEPQDGPTSLLPVGAEDAMPRA
jgi:pSer/pThr/pTyr-binding forkhead associated (FHA) protein